MSKKVNVEVDLAVVKQRLDSIELVVNEIKENHLHTLQEKVDIISDELRNSINNLKVQMAYYVGGGAAIIILVQIVISVIK